MSTAHLYVTDDEVLVRFDYDAKVNGVMRNRLGATWSARCRCWSLPADATGPATEVLQGLGFEVVVHRSEEPSP